MKVLILSCSTGEGHNSAAKAMNEEFKRRNIETDFKDALSFGNKESEKLVKGFFNKVASKAPSLFGIMYKAGSKISNPNIKSPIYYANLLYANNLHEYIITNNIDIVVCSHLFPMEALTYLKRKNKITTKCYGILTDYTIIPFLEETELDGYFLSDKSLIKKLSSKKVPRKKIYAYGIPVSNKYTIKRTKKESRNLLKLPNKKIIMIMTGGIGCGNIKSIITAILSNINDNILILVLIGKNQSLKEKIDNSFDDKVLTVDFTDKVEIYMDASDVLLSKPGGLSSTEAGVKKVPLIHTMPIPGCETENANFFDKNGMSIKVNNNIELVSAVKELLTNTKRVDKMIKRQSKINSYASRDIVDCILKKFE